jgi:anti-sigma B factor antagonist
VIPGRENFYQEIGQEDGLTVWRISGFLQDVNVPFLKGKMAELVAHGVKDVLVDFDGLKAIDSRGLGFLVTLQKELRMREGRLALVHLNAQFAALLELTKLNRVFEIFLDKETAKRSFGGTHLKQPEAPC